MYYQPVNRPQAFMFRSPEDLRALDEQLRNVERLIDYNNRRAARGLRPVQYPPALIDFSRETLEKNYGITLQGQTMGARRKNKTHYRGVSEFDRCR